MRLFIAILPEDSVKAALTEVQASMRAQGVRANFSREENLHLTLAFLGETPALRAACEAMQEIDCSPFWLELAGSGAFGDVVYAALSQNGTLSRMAYDLRAALKRRGLPVDEKPFRAHITLVRRVISQHRMTPIVLNAKMRVRAISLMESTRDAAGKLIYRERFRRTLNA